jgi:hypothetical protein
MLQGLLSDGRRLLQLSFDEGIELALQIQINTYRFGKEVTKLSLAVGFRSSSTKDGVLLVGELLAPFHVGLFERVVLHDLVVVLVHLCKSQHFVVVVVVEHIMRCCILFSSLKILPEYASLW